MVNSIKVLVIVDEVSKDLTLDSKITFGTFIKVCARLWNCCLSRAWLQMGDETYFVEKDD